MSNNKLNNNIIENITGVGDNNKNKTNLINSKTTINYYNYKINENTENKINRPGLQYGDNIANIIQTAKSTGNICSLRVFYFIE